MEMIRKMKRISSLVVIVMLLGVNTQVYAADGVVINNEAYEESLTNAYAELKAYARNMNIPFSMEMDAFIQEYYDLGYSNVEEYVNVYYSLFSPQISTRSSLTTAGSKWYYNTGTSLPQTANYSKYNLLNTVQVGDVIYESKGGFGITGHIAIVEGKYYDSTQKQYYIRVIEAIDKGVVRSVLDDGRVDDKGVSVYRVTRATNSQKQMQSISARDSWVKVIRWILRKIQVAAR